MQHMTMIQLTVSDCIANATRFDRLLYVPPPDRDSKLQIITIHTKKKPLADYANLEQLADHTGGYTGADIASLSLAVMLALREHVSNNKDPKKTTVICRN